MGGANLVLHYTYIFTTRMYFCTRVQILHMNTALDSLLGLSFILSQTGYDAALRCAGVFVFDIFKFLYQRLFVSVEDKACQYSCNNAGLYIDNPRPELYNFLRAYSLPDMIECQWDDPRDDNKILYVYGCPLVRNHFRGKILSRFNSAAATLLVCLI